MTTSVIEYTAADWVSIITAVAAAVAAVIAAGKARNHADRAEAAAPPATHEAGQQAIERDWPDHM